MQVDDFWLLIAALSKFVAQEGQGYLPLTGKIPDMKADTNSFVRLQKMFIKSNFRYKEKAKSDQSIMFQHMTKIAESLKREPISMDVVALFCKNCRDLACLKSRGLSEELDGLPSKFVADASSNISPDYMIYFLLRAIDRFKNLKGYFPGYSFLT
jgi:amyloid beta precursor protein binding protein 1